MRSYENSGKVLQNVTNASQRPLVFMLRGAAPGGMGNSHENPLSGGKEGFSLQGWVLPFGTTHPDTPPMEGNPIFMLNGAAQAAWGTPV